MSPENEQNSEKEFEKICLEIEKLQAETANLKSIIRFIPMVTAIIALLGFGFGIWQHDSQQKEDFESKKLLSEKEFRRKYYEKQLDVYLDMSQTVAGISILDDKNKIQEEFKHFLTIKNGNLLFVNTDKFKDNQIINASNEFEKAFNNKVSKDDLQKSARNLSIILRNSLTDFWGFPFPVENFPTEEISNK